MSLEAAEVLREWTELWHELFLYGDETKFNQLKNSQKWQIGVVISQFFLLGASACVSLSVQSGVQATINYFYWEGVSVPW